jgi:hypothetical protein
MTQGLLIKPFDPAALLRALGELSLPPRRTLGKVEP